MTIRVGILGCGGIAGNHVEAYREVADVEVVACADVDRPRARSFAEKYNLPIWVGSLGELLEAGVDVLSVCTPHPTHEQAVIDAAREGVHVLCEKPIALATAAAQRMVDACDTSGVQLGVLFQRRFWPASQKVRKAIDEGVLGTPFLGHCSVLLHRDPDYFTRDPWRGKWDSDGGGVLMTQAIHYIDLLQWFMGPVAEVTGRCGTYIHGDYIEVEDAATALLTFTSGAMATISATTGLTPAEGVQIRITGSSGATVALAEYPEGTGRLEIWDVPGQVFHAPVLGSAVNADVSSSVINEALKPYHALQVSDFIAALRENREPAVTGVEAMKSLRVVEAIYESHRTGRTVRFDPAHLASHVS